jgi:uncharacterized DUF497 family protein
MTGLTRKRWYFFIWDEHNEAHLALHKIQSWEAEEVFFKERYMIVGRTNARRKLRLVFEDFGQNTARIFTGWDI